MNNIKENIKLVIWDMDETFWKGTISEEKITINIENINIIKILSKRGIVNSISSKNDFEVVEKKLKELKVWDYFVFPKINWNPKGQQVKQIIEECKLRPVNVLFIDDNPHNLGEAKSILPELNILDANKVSGLLNSKFLQGNNDKELKRLKQFKVLEEKTVAQEASSSNEEFLFNSNIEVEICQNCKKEKERIFDLINKSNQLNYTKIRLTAKELDELLKNKQYKNYYIKVKDKYGDYGIVGFISIDKNNHAQHFLFSCRTIGLGIEQYVYSKFNYPTFEQKGEVISGVSKYNCPEWINQKNKHSKEKENKLKTSVLLHGGCDLRQMESYMHFEKFTPEYNFRTYHRDHSVYAINSYNKHKELKEIKDKIPFVWEHSFETEIFTNKHNVIILSVLMDYIQGVYQHKKNKNIKIAYGNYRKPLSENYTENYTKEELNWFFQNFEFIGRTTKKELIEYLNFIRNTIDKDVVLIILNGCEVEHENPNEIDQHLIHKEMNQAVDEFVNNSTNTYLIDIRKIVTSRKQLNNSIRHYERKTYYNIANEISQIIMKKFGEKIKVGKFEKNIDIINYLKANVKNKLKNIFSINNKYKSNTKIKILKIFNKEFVIKKIILDSADFK